MKNGRSWKIEAKNMIVYRKFAIRRKIYTDGPEVKPQEARGNTFEEHVLTENIITENIIEETILWENVETQSWD